MPSYSVKFIRLDTTGGPFAYVIEKDGIGKISVDGVTAGNLLSSISTSLTSLLGSESVDRGSMTVRTS